MRITGTILLWGKRSSEEVEGGKEIGAELSEGL